MKNNLGRPVNRTSLRHEVYARVKAALLSGEIQPGDTITETAIADQLGTSRAPVREALRQLEQESLIVSLGHRGYGAPEASEHDVHEITRFRIALEKLAVVLFIERAEAADYAALEVLIEEMERASEAGDKDRVTEIDHDFHARLCEAARHELLLSTWNGIRAQLTLAMRAMNMSFASAEGIADRHRLIVAALRTGDPAEAENTMENHILTGITSLGDAQQEKP